MEYQYDSEADVIETIGLFICLSIGVLWGFDLLVITKEQRPLEAWIAGSMIGFALTNLLYKFVGI